MTDEDKQDLQKYDYSDLDLEKVSRGLSRGKEKEFLLACTYLWEGTSLTEKGSIDEAIEKIQLAVNLFPEHPEFHFNLGIAYDKKAGIAVREAAKRKTPYAEIVS